MVSPPRLTAASLAFLVMAAGPVVSPYAADAATPETTEVTQTDQARPSEPSAATEPASPAETPPAPEPVANPEAAADDEPAANAEPTTGPELAPSAEAASAEPAEPIDPLSQEAPGEAAPDTDVTVPPPEPDGTEDLREPARILWSSVGAAERKLTETHEKRAETIASARVLRKRRKELRVESQQLGAESAATVAEITAATDRFRTRAVLGFQQFGSGSEQEESPEFSDYQEIVDDQRRSRMVDSALKFDQVDLDRLAELQGRLNSDGRAVLDRIRVVSDHIAEIEVAVSELDEIIEEATTEYEAFLAGSQIFIHGAVFPIAPGYDTNLIDSWGFPRMVGTEDEHGHEGIDIFAPSGTPLVAAERGVIERLGVGRLGGLKFWIRGESGSDWYYAHLDSFAPGLENGMVVDVGDLVGYVGDTGNAVGTPPHLHLQLHPGGGDPVNPYPLLRVVSDLQQKASAEGTFSGYDYEVVVSDRPDPPPDTTTTVAGEPSETTQPVGTDQTTMPTAEVPAEPAAVAPWPEPTVPEAGSETPETQPADGAPDPTSPPEQEPVAEPNQPPAPTNQPPDGGEATIDSDVTP